MGGAKQQCGADENGFPMVKPNLQAAIKTVRALKP
jgi:hypothetical protein